MSFAHTHAYFKVYEITTWTNHILLYNNYYNICQTFRIKCKDGYSLQLSLLINLYDIYIFFEILITKCKTTLATALRRTAFENLESVENFPKIFINSGFFQKWFKTIFSMNSNYNSWCFNLLFSKINML